MKRVYTHEPTTLGIFYIKSHMNWTDRKNEVSSGTLIKSHKKVNMLLYVQREH